MESIIRAPLDSPVILAITIILFITDSITTFDTRLLQAKRRGELPSNHPSLPKWVALLYWFHYGLFAVLLFMNWKYGLALVAFLFVLKVLPVLETIGNVLMSPFRPKD